MTTLLQRLGNALVRSIPVNPVRSKLDRAVASVTFDDIPWSAARIGGPIVEAAGARATYYVCGSHTGATFEDREQHATADLVRLHEAGHEIACHTYGHPDVSRLGDEGRLADSERNAGFVRDLLGDVVMSSFAYPYGRVSVGAKAFYSRRHFTCRGVYPGLNAGLMDFAELRAVGIERRSHDIGRVRDYVAKAKDEKAWLIFFTHDVLDDPSPYGCSPRDLEGVLQALADGGVEVLTVKAAAARVMHG